MDTGRAVFVAQRVDEDGPELWSYGSGFLIGGRFVLTAAHVVAEGRARIQQGGRIYDATVVLRGSADGGTDLAILRITDADFDDAVPPARLAQVDRSSPHRIENCWAVGFPSLKARPDRQGLRDSAHVHGTIAPAANRISGDLELQVGSTPTVSEYPGAQESPWEAMSGAVVFCSDPHLGEVALGVVGAHPLQEGPSSLSVTPIVALSALPEAGLWWELLGISGVSALVVVPGSSNSAQSRYELVVDEVARRTPELLDREEDLADLMRFACHGSGYRWLVGRPWSGKTALVAHLLRGLPPTVDAVAYFLSRRHGNADSSRFAAAVIEQLSALTGSAVPPLDRPEAAREALLFLWRHAAALAEVKQRRLVLIVDGLDEDLSSERGLPSVASMLPTLVSERTCVLVSSRSARPVVDVDHPLRWSSTPVQTVGPTQRARRLKERADDDLDALLSVGHGTAPLPSTGAGRPDILAFLVAAEAPLSLRDLVQLTGGNGWEIQRLLTTDLARVVEVGAGPDHHITLSHDTLRERATIRLEEYGTLTPTRERILAWADDHAVAGWLSSPLPPYLVDNYPGLIARIAPHRLRSILFDMTFLEAAVRARGVGRVHNVLRAAVVEAGFDLGHPVLRLLTQEAKNLEGAPVGGPIVLAVQLRNRARMLGQDNLVRQFDVRLDELAIPHLRLRWRIPAESPALESSLIAGNDPVRALASILDGRCLVSGDGDTLRLWSVETGLHEDIGRHESTIMSVLATLDGRRAVVRMHDQSVAMWDLEQRAPLRTLFAVSDVALSDDGRVFAATAKGVEAFGADGQKQRTLMRAPLTQAAIAVDHRGTVVALGQGSGSVRVWQLPGGRAVTRTLGAGVTALALSSNGQHLVVGTADGRLHAWNPATGEHPRTLSTELSGGVHRLCVSDSGILVTHWQGGIGSWDLATGRLLNHVRAEDRLTRPGIAMGAALALTPDGRLAVCGLGAEVVVMETASQGRVKFLRGHGQVVLATAVSPDGRHAFSACEDYSINVWDLEQPELEPPFHGHDDRVSAVALNAEGVAAATGASDGTISVWNVATGERRNVIGAHEPADVDALSWELTGGGLVSAGSDMALRFWDGAERARLAVDLPFSPSAMSAITNGALVLVSGDGDVAICRDGRLDTLRVGKPSWIGRPCSVSSDGRVAILSPPEGQPGLVKFDVSGRTETLIDVAATWNQELADNGDMLAIPRADALELWDLNRELCTEILVGGGEVRVCALSGWPGVVVTGGWDRTVRAWTSEGHGARTSKEVVPRALWACDDEVVALAISRDGTTIVAGTNGGAVICLELRLPAFPGVHQ